MSQENKSPRVGIIIPAYNEGGVIAGVINAISATLKKDKYLFEIIVVDDGSKDDTPQKAKQTGVCVIRHILNTGTGGATATGLSYAQQNGFEMAATIDADGQHSPADLLKGIKLMHAGTYDLLIGSRLLDSEGMSRTKRIGNKGLSFTTYLLFGVNVTDSQSGLRIFSKKALDELKWKTNGFEFCSEMLWRAKQQGLRIGEYPIKAIYTDYSKAKGQNNWNAFNIIKSLLKQRVVELISE